MKRAGIGKIFLAILLTGLATEIGLRLFVGLGKPALIQADVEMGYRFQPNQKTRRFGNWVEYNQYSQRSEPIDREKNKGTLRIVMLGDSVLNGGNRTDQQETISEQLETQLKATGRETEVLNASANSWGIGNQLGYLQKFGLFNADAVILQIGTHDLVQPMNREKDLDLMDYPPSALSELWYRYLLPRISRFLRREREVSGKVPVSLEKSDLQFAENLQHLQAIAALVRREKLSLWVIYTPSREDILPVPKDPPYKTQFFQFLQEEEIPAIDIHRAWSELSSQRVKSYFVDWAHLTPKGQRSVAELVFNTWVRDRDTEKSAF